jgi:uncharacterized protein (TIGR02302 family)
LVQDQRRDLDEMREPAEETLDRSLARLSARAGLALWWERLWPAMVPVLCVAALFLAASWFGTLAVLPHWARLAALVLFGLAFVAALVPLARVTPPAAADRLRRIDRDSGTRHAPATAWADRLAAGAEDGGSRSLWTLHRQRTAAALAQARVGWPRPGMVRRDRRALRVVPLLLVAAGFFAAGPDRVAKVADALDPGAVAAPKAEARIDGWIDPPEYTRVPPIVIDLAQARAKPLVLRAPVGSTLVLRWPEKSGIAAQPEGGLAAQGKPSAQSGAEETRWRLTADSRLTVTGAGGPAHLTIAAIPDEPPTIRIVGDPKINIRGPVTLAYEGTDDYGIVSVTPRFSDPKWRGKPVVGRPIIEPPTADLPPPTTRPGAPPTRATFDLSAHPWAGTEVTLRLAAKDGAGHEAVSEPVTLTLPEHPFTNALARALIEQRRDLALDAGKQPRVLEALYALMIAPEEFMPQAGIYIALRSIAKTLATARADATLVKVVGDLWELALVIEGSGPARSLDQLRAAEKALKDALANGASKEEIEQRMAELRQALDKYLRELAQRSKENPRSRRADRDRQMLTERDLQHMLDRMQEMAKNGETDRAQRMLDQLSQLLDNLQTAEGDQNGDDQQMSEEEQALDAMSDLLRKELELRDDTQAAGRQPHEGKRPGKQGGQRGGKQGQQGQQGQNGDGDQAQQGQGGDGDQGAMGGLSQRQRELRRRLEELGRKLGGMGAGDAAKGMGEAGREMQDAERALGEGDAPDALGAEGRAIEAMRKGMNALSEQLAREQGQNPGQMGQNGRGRSRGVRAGRDPLGRGVDRSDDESEGEYDNGAGYGRRNGLKGNTAERAREILDELRRRLGETSRGKEELDYIERLLGTQ